MSLQYKCTLPDGTTSESSSTIAGFFVWFSIKAQANFHDKKIENIIHTENDSVLGIPL